MLGHPEFMETIGRACFGGFASQIPSTQGCPLKMRTGFVPTRIPLVKAVANAKSEFRTERCGCRAMRLLVP